VGSPLQDPISKEFTIYGVIVEAHHRWYWIRMKSSRILACKSLVERRDAENAVPYAPAESAESIGPILAMQQQANTMISHSSLEKWENLSIKTLIYQFNLNFAF
jgi:hypothetical protein